MAEAEKDDVGSTGDGKGGEAAGRDVAKGDDATTAESKGTIGTGSEDADLSQASGGSVD